MQYYLNKRKTRWINEENGKKDYVYLETANGYEKRIIIYYEKKDKELFVCVSHNGAQIKRTIKETFEGVNVIYEKES